jgi:hypothetical protein
MRALNGAPSEVYYLIRKNTWNLFISINSSKVNGHFHNFETEVSPDGSGDTKINNCGITFSHAYKILDTFQI